MTEMQRRQAYLQATGELPGGDELDERQRQPQETRSSRPSASTESDDVTTCRALLQMIPALAVLSLALSIAGLAVVCAGFAISKTAVIEFVRAHQDRKDVTFDMMCPNVTNSIIGIVVGTFTYSALHFLVNCVTSDLGGDGRGMSHCKCAIAASWIFLDVCVTTGWSLILCICFLPLFAHVSYANRLQRGIRDLDLNHYVTSFVVNPNLVVTMPTDSDAAEAPPIEPASFATFYPILALFIGAGVVLAAQILHSCCLAGNLSSSNLAKKKGRRSCSKKEVMALHQSE